MSEDKNIVNNHIEDIANLADSEHSIEQKHDIPDPVEDIMPKDDMILKKDKISKEDFCIDHTDNITSSNISNSLEEFNIVNEEFQPNNEQTQDVNTTSDPVIPSEQKKNKFTILKLKRANFNKLILYFKNFNLKKIDLKKLDRYKIMRILFSIGFVVFTVLFINEVFIEPYRISKSIEQTRELYNPNTYDSSASTQAGTSTPHPTVAAEPTPGPTTEPVVTPDPNRDEKGRLLQFQDLLDVNEDVKGWLTIPDTNMDYVVMQSNNDEKEFYLTHDLYKKELKAGSLFLDYKSSVEKNTKNLVIHGHNMKSTDNMFHYLVQYKKLDFYKARPVFTFDTIYQTGKWKIFAVIITNGTSKKEPLFNYTRSVFKDNSDYMNFVYQIRIRSLFNFDTVDINENDQILGLSTCSYELNDYRTVVFARRVREGEDLTVDVESVKKNPHTLFPSSYYQTYGGEAPDLAPTFEEALKNKEISWYKSVESNKEHF